MNKERKRSKWEGKKGEGEGGEGKAGSVGEWREVSSCRQKTAENANLITF